MAASRQVELEVKGMTCGHCVRAVKESLAALAGVASVEVTLEPPRARVTIDPDVVSTADLEAATAAEGYPSAVAE
jgi:copper chaperone